MIHYPVKKAIPAAPYYVRKTTHFTNHLTKERRTYYGKLY